MNTSGRAAVGWGVDQGTVEAEAIPTDAIESHIPAGHLDRIREIEQEERATLERMADEVAE